MLKFNLNSELEKPSKERLDYLRKQVKYLETLPQHEQRSPECFKFREGLLTASDWGTVLGNNNKVFSSNSVTIGNNLVNKFNDCILLGRYNIPEYDWKQKLLVVGNGVVDKKSDACPPNIPP